MNTEQVIPDIDAPRLKQRLDAGEPLAVLDVREDFERAFCSIPLPTTAVDLHVPLGQVPERLADLRGVIADRPLVVYCHHGIRSRAAAEWLQRRGLAEVVNLEGGIDAWSLGVDPAVLRY